LIFSTNLSGIFLIVTRIEQDITINVLMSSCKVPVVLVRLQRNLDFLDSFSKKNSSIKFH